MGIRKVVLKTLMHFLIIILLIIHLIIFEMSFTIGLIMMPIIAILYFFIFMMGNEIDLESYNKQTNKN